MIGYEVVFLFINLGLAYVHSRLILHDKKIVHWLWALVYAVLVTIGYFLTKNWWMVAAAILIRELVFAQVLNGLRKKSMFYVNPKTGSVIDGLQGQLYKYVWFASLAVFLFTQYKILRPKTAENV